MMNPDPHGVTIKCVQGDIARQPDVEAIVNAANGQLRIGGGVAGAIHRAAGPSLEEKSRPFAPIQPGQAVITGGHELPNRHVIHCLGPVDGVDKPADRLLASRYGNALQLAERNGIRSLAFPAISTGAFRYPMEPAAQVAFVSVLDMKPQLSTMALIRFVLFRGRDLRLHDRALQEMRASREWARAAACSRRALSI